MDLFARVNAVYAIYFGTSPPARACVAVDLPSPIRVRLDCVAYAERTPADRQALHVQSISYWAPANIGPYSQAVTVDERVFISGQIGMIPSSLALPAPRSLALEAALAFQHVHRVIDALKNNSGGGWPGRTQGVLYWLVNEEDIPPIRVASAQHTEVGACNYFDLREYEIDVPMVSFAGQERADTVRSRAGTTKGCAGGEASPRSHWPM